MDKFLGKGISIGVVFKFLIYNSAWIISLAIPMAVLIAVLMSFGRLSSDNEITAFKASGISLEKLMAPAIMFGALVFLIITPFNLWILPEMNHNVRKLSLEISRNRPDVEFNEQLLNNLADKIIYVGDRRSNTSFDDIIIFNKSQKNHTTIISDYGSFESLQDGIIINLINGSIHESISSSEYRKTYFDNYKIAIPFDQIEYNRTNNLIRQERELNFQALVSKIKLYTNKNTAIKNDISMNLMKIDSLENKLSYMESNKNTDLLLQNKLKKQISNTKSIYARNEKLFTNYLKKINKYSVELHKKFSIPIACFVFILLGVPLGIISKNKNMSISISISIIFFIIYWAFLILGEDFADRGKLNPAISMWAPNIFLGFIAYYLYKLVSKENLTFKIDFNILKYIKMKQRQ
jgi:lipopolysaccharide export system permease protein